QRGPAASLAAHLLESSPERLARVPFGRETTACTGSGDGSVHGPNPRPCFAEQRVSGAETACSGWNPPSQLTPLAYLGGNCELGTGSARLAVGALSMTPITAQLMSTPAAPSGAPPGPVIRSGRVAARLKTCTSSIWRLSRPSLIALSVHWPSWASQSGLYASACRGSASVGKSPNTLSRSPPLRSASIRAVLPALASSE